MFQAGDRVTFGGSDVPCVVVGVSDSGKSRLIRFHDSKQPFTMPVGRLRPIPAEPDKGVEGVPPPNLHGVAAGAHLWQQADASHRHVFIHCRGHVVSVTASLTPIAEAFTVKFLCPCREDAVGFALDFACANGSRKPVEIGHSHTFPEI